MAEHEISLGKGLQFLVVTLSVCVLIGIGAVAGVTWYKSEQHESNQLVQKIDSEESVEITIETKEVKAEVHEKVNALENPTVDADGYMDDEFLQLMESARTAAIERGDSSGIINTITRR